MPARPQKALPVALAVSALAHALAFAPIALTMLRARAGPPPPDRWAGGGAGGDEVSVELGEGAVDRAPAAPPAAPPAKATPGAPAAAAEPPAKASTAAAGPVRQARERDGAEPAGGEARRASGQRAERGRPSGAAPPRPSGAGREAATSGLGAGEAGPSRGVGAAGAPSPRDLGRAFTRAIAPGSQADGAWSSLPAGWTGSIEIVLELDASGSIAGFEVLGDKAPAPLRELVRRTAALLRGGIFAPRGGAPGAGKVRLKLRARTHNVDPDATPGGSIDIEFAFENGKGQASFTQAGGRRVNVDVEAVR